MKQRTSPNYRAAKLAQYEAQRVETLTELSRWPNGCCALAIGPLTRNRLLMAQKRGWVAKTGCEGAFDDPVWTVTEAGRAQLESQAA